ncbi:MAG: DUF7093 family protein [Halobacteriota archaeon]
MGLRCLLGHDFGEPELKREREEQGSEVVVTVREITVCSRCGAEQVVSENKEVTSVEQLSAAATGADVDPQAGAVEGAPESIDQSIDDAPPRRTDPAPEAGGNASSTDARPGTATSAATSSENPFDEGVSDDAEIITAGPSDSSASDSSSADSIADSPAHTDRPQQPTPSDTDDGDLPGADADSRAPDSSAEPDDGIILPDEPSTDVDDREPGAWPVHDDGVDSDAAADRVPWPDPEGTDDGFDASKPSEGGPEDVTFGGGFTPEITESTTESDEPTIQSDDGFTRADPATVEFEPMEDDVRTEFFCPECGLSKPAGGSSMRAGDICPKCRKGYISERPM